MRNVLRLAVAISLSITVSASLQASTVVLTPSKDNTLYEDANGNLSNGIGEFLFVGRTAFGPTLLRRAVLAFDLSAIPPGATVTGATLSLYLNRESNTAPFAFPMTVRRLVIDWGEGASDASFDEGTGTAAVPPDATWAHRMYNTAPWTTPGGDFALGVSATASVGGGINTFYSWSSPGLVSNVQGWLNGTFVNAGWILLGSEGTAGSAKRFTSKDSASVAERPKLTVDYTPGSGRVPDRVSAGLPLTLGKSGASLALTWGPSCTATDTDYGVYEGTVGGSFTSHVPVVCTTLGLTSATISPAAGSTYYLVVPHDASGEGSYGVRTPAVERSPSASACLPQVIGACP